MATTMIKIRFDLEYPYNKSLQELHYMASLWGFLITNSATNQNYALAKMSPERFEAIFHEKKAKRGPYVMPEALTYFINKMEIL